MRTKKILLIGLSQDINEFLKGLFQIQGDLYSVNSQTVEIKRPAEQSLPGHLCSITLDGYDAVIQVFNTKDSKAPTLQQQIPDGIPSFIYVLDGETEKPENYVDSVVLNELRNKGPYRHQEPSVASLFASLFCFTPAKQPTCTVDHGLNQSSDIKNVSYVIASK